ncbi:PiggyBac transposable element-derived protein 2 [Trichinella nativa]|uniref:PiggyBac transposable element-derived protein 2 n=1 Tax=Trichinella nativa TaxID=6335 RepID=A0A0V1KXD9_9BILA|nr:PiggyBac transposable element-derived protein 2 [Trichinella nativa]
MVNPMKDETEASTSHDASTSSSVVNNDSLEGRRCEQVKILEKAKDVITTSNQVLNVVMLPSTAGDSGTGELEVEEELDVEEFEDISLSQKQRGALSQWKKAFTVSPQEIRQFIGLILLSGYNCQPEAKHYWSTQPDIGAQGAISCMSHNRFMKIKKYLHLAHNQKLVKGDKMSKVTPLYKLLNSSLVKHGMFHEKLSVDSTILWSPCGKNVFKRQTNSGKEIHASKVPLSTRVISNMVDIIQENSNTTRHTLYFDNFFNSYDLLVMLSELKMRAIGTIRSNGVDAVMLPDKDLMKQNRSAFGFRNRTDHNSTGYGPRPRSICAEDLNLQVDKLESASNWSRWKRQIQLVLCHHAVLEVAIGKTVAPAVSNPESLKKHEEALKTFEKEDTLAQLIFVSSMNDANVDLTARSKFALEIWQKLTAVYEQSSGPRVDRLMEEFFKCAKWQDISPGYRSFSQI